MQGLSRGMIGGAVAVVARLKAFGVRDALLVALARLDHGFADRSKRALLTLFAPERGDVALVRIAGAARRQIGTRRNGTVIQAAAARRDRAAARIRGWPRLRSIRRGACACMFGALGARCRDSACSPGAVLHIHIGAADQQRADPTSRGERAPTHRQSGYRAHTFFEQLYLERQPSNDHGCATPRRCSSPGARFARQLTSFNGARLGPAPRRPRGVRVDGRRASR